MKINVNKLTVGTVLVNGITKERSVVSRVVIEPKGKRSIVLQYSRPGETLYRRLGQNYLEKSAWVKEEER